MNIQFTLLILYFIRYSYSQLNSIDKPCNIGDSKCENGQICTNNRCQCDPAQRQFWAGDQLKCRVCPSHYYRTRRQMKIRNRIINMSLSI